MIAGAIVVGSTVLALRLRQSAAASGGPIILISIDTLRADHLPAYGYRALATPGIDALAADGILFERAYSHVPLTLPAHTSMLSGLLPMEHGVRDNVGFRVKTEARLLPHWLRERGFATGGVVSADVLRGDTGIGQGFEFYDDRMPPTFAGASLDEAQRDGAASLVVGRGWMEAQASSRFFLFLHLYEPHAPYTPPARYAGYTPYDGEIACADEIVARLTQWLRDRGWYDGATIFLMSDHGEGLSDHGEPEHGLFLYEEAVHVPFIVKLPGQKPRGRRVKELVQHVDLLPTILDLVGAPVPSTLPGRSLRPLLEGRADPWPQRGIYSEALFGRYHFGWSELFSLSDSRYRFIRAPRPEFYDLQQDPHERHDLTGEASQSRLAMERALDQLLEGTRLQQPGAVPSEARERLAALGYVGPRSSASPVPRDAKLPDPKDKISVLVRYRRALELVGQGQLAAAIEVLRQLTQEEPAMGDLRLRMARLLARVGRTQEAVDVYKESVRLDPTSASGLIELSAALLKLRRPGEAHAHAELAAKVAANEARVQAAAYEMLAKIALARADAEAARRYGTLGRQSDASFPLPDYVEGRLAYASEDYPRAWTHFEKALEASRSRTIQIPDLHLYAGDTLAHLQRFDEAEREFKEEIRFFADNTWAYMSLANLYQTFGRAEEADRVLSGMKQRVPSPEAFALAGKFRGGSRPSENGKR